MLRLKFLRLFTAASMLVAGAAQHAQAAFTHGDSTLGSGSLVHDSMSGLSWLKLDFTYNLSYEFVTANLGAGGVFDGFRVASSSEVGDLFTHAQFVPEGGYDPDTLAYSAERDQANLEFATAFGGASTDNGLLFRGLTVNYFNPFQQVIASTSYVAGATANFWANDVYSPDGYIFNSSPVVGTWLIAPSVVTAPVPEPSTYALMFAGLAAVGAWGRRRRRAD